MKDSKVVPIFFTVDDNYVPYLAVAIQSLLENADKKRQYHLIIVHNGLNDDNCKSLRRLERPFASVILVKMEQNLSAIKDVEENRLRADYFTLTIYFRLFIPEMFEQYERGLYLDSDIVVNDDISKLYDMDIGNAYIGACTDGFIVQEKILMNYAERAIGVKPCNYINSGVLLLNMEALRRAKIGSHFLGLLNKYHFDTIAPDQDYINAICAKRICLLKDCWNKMPLGEAAAKEAVPSLIHFNLFSKPWFYDNILYQEIFWEYAKKTEFYDRLLAIRTEHALEQKKDAEAMEFLFMRAEHIAEGQNTFRVVGNIQGGIRI